METINYKGHEIKLIQDEDPQNPVRSGIIWENGLFSFTVWVRG